MLICNHRQGLESALLCITMTAMSTLPTSHECFPKWEMHSFGLAMSIQILTKIFLAGNSLERLQHHLALSRCPGVPIAHFKHFVAQIRFLTTPRKETWLDIGPPANFTKKISSSSNIF